MLSSAGFATAVSSRMIEDVVARNPVAERPQWSLSSNSASAMRSVISDEASRDCVQCLLRVCLP